MGFQANPYQTGQSLSLQISLGQTGHGPGKRSPPVRAPLGGVGPWSHFGLLRSHCEWKAISNGRLLRSHFENFEWKDENQAAEGFRRLTTRYPDVKAKCFDVKFRDCEHFDSRNTFKPHLAPEALDREPFKWTFSHKCFPKGQILGKVALIP